VAATAGFFLNPALNSAMNSCAHIDEEAARNVSLERDKMFRETWKLQAKIFNLPQTKFTQSCQR
jgi:hypothetical protein